MELLSGAFELYTAAAYVFLDPTTIALLLLGGVIGAVFGLLPGLTSTMALALMLPFTLWMEPEQGIVFLIAIYATSVWAGSSTAILVNIPGTPAAMVTGIDGYQMALRGEAGRAIGAATTASAIGGLLGMVVLVLVAIPLAEVALKFGSWEMAALVFLGLSLMAFVSGRSIVKGMIAGIFGLLLKTIGMEPILGYPRFTLGMADLLSGLALIPVLIGFFGVAEVLTQLGKKEMRIKITQRVVGVFSVFSEIRRLPGVLFRSSLIGVFIGAIPGSGPAISSVTAYAIGKRVSKRGKEFGTGITEGVVTAEAANNACVGGALIPMLTLGIPGDAMTAVLLGALMFHGLTPGPLLFVNNPVFISSIFISLTFSSFLILLFGLGGARLFAKVLTVPSYILLPLIAFLCMVGAYAIRNSLFDIGVATVTGILGYLMRKVDIPPAPLILGLVLGPLFEDNVRRALVLGKGSVIPFFTRPISLSVLILTILVLFGPPISRMLRAKIGRRAK